MQYNIYFRKDNWLRFEKEGNKSRLVNELLDKHYGQYPVVGAEYPKVRAKVGVSDNIKPSRPLSNILGEIRETERLRDEELEFCQDEAEGKRITDDAKEVIDALWAEYHEAKKLS